MSTAPPRRGTAPVTDVVPPLRGARTAAGTILALAGALAMGLTARSLTEQALTGFGPTALLSAVLAVIAALGALLCLYLALIWGLTSLVLVSGPAGAVGRTVLPALRVLAPRLARQVVLGAGATATLAGLTLSGASAAVLAPGPEATGTACSQQLAPGVSPAAEVEGTAAPAGDAAGATWCAAVVPAEDAAPTADERPGEGSTAEPSTPDEEELPGLGWDGTPAAEPEDAGPSSEPSAPAQQDAPQDDTGEQDADAEDDTAPEDRPADPPRTVVVGEGDTLWSITDALLGDGPEPDAEVAAAWPDLYQHNREAIGTDPDLLRPGQVLQVPAGLDQQEQG